MYLHSAGSSDALETEQAFDSLPQRAQSVRAGGRSRSGMGVHVLTVDEDGREIGETGAPRRPASAPSSFWSWQLRQTNVYA